LSTLGRDDKGMDILQATPHNLLTVDQADELVRNASQPAFGAIEDAEVSDDAVAYIFEDGRIATVCRRSGDVSFEVQQ
jgi:hypothetical protein